MSRKDEVPAQFKRGEDWSGPFVLAPEGCPIEGAEVINWHRMEDAPKTGEEIMLFIPTLGERPAEWRGLGIWISPVDGESIYDDPVAWRWPLKGPSW